MIRTANSVPALVDAVLGVPLRGRRRLIAVSGPPASGKSTLTSDLAAALNAADHKTVVIPMDGFHYANQHLVEIGLLDRKGSPDTFDVQSFLELVGQLHNAETLRFPTFDREKDVTLPNTGTLSESCETVLIEGNYLAYDAPYWRDLHVYWDLSIAMDVPEDILHHRLVERWLQHGLSLKNAEQRAESNDLQNARAIATSPLDVDIRVHL